MSEVRIDTAICADVLEKLSNIAGTLKSIRSKINNNAASLCRAHGTGYYVRSSMWLNSAANKLNDCCRVIRSSIDTYQLAEEKVGRIDWAGSLEENTKKYRRPQINYQDISQYKMKINLIKKKLNSKTWKRISDPDIDLLGISASYKSADRFYLYGTTLITVSTQVKVQTGKIVNSEYDIDDIVNKQIAELDSISIDLSGYEYEIADEGMVLNLGTKMIKDKNGKEYPTNISIVIGPMITNPIIKIVTEIDDNVEIETTVNLNALKPAKETQPVAVQEPSFEINYFELFKTVFYATAKYKLEEMKQDAIKLKETIVAVRREFISVLTHDYGMEEAAAAAMATMCIILLFGAAACMA